ncbi:Chemotaxis protein CheA [Neisseria animaloris]|uniref:ATP-binding protein n=1 Tax=Neisseria animaloris TaxID=326522 RepID=UPI000A191FD1|nr:ATP-binding protein [Neisseria animaloris]OSI08749.1 hypothetical protein BWD08_01125 [Neisseria animaloris]VEH87287.1 Chemotaxis protein CheA [Neisseria animaloris]
MDNAQKTFNEQKFSFKRYRNVIISIALFLLFVSGLMFAGYRISGQIQRSQLQIDVAGTLSDTVYDMLTITQSLQLLSMEKLIPETTEVETNGDAGGNIEAANDPEYIALQVEKQKLLDEYQKVAKNLLNVLDKGGAYDVVEGFNSVAPLKVGDTRQSLQKVQGIWKDYNSLIDDAVKYSVASNQNMEFARKVSTFASDNQDALYEGIDEIIVGLNEDITEKAALLRWIQISGIALSLLYFLFFVGFFMRRLGKADLAAAVARRENTEIMQTINNGLFLLDKDLNIGSQYSSELERLWGKQNLGGQNMLSVLSDMVANPEDLETAGSFVQQLYNPRTKERLIASLNPLIHSPMNVMNESGVKEKRYLDFKFNRVYDNEEIVRVLVSVSDVTNAVLLEEKITKEREQNDLQMEMLTFILKADPQLLTDFIENTKKRNNNINEVLKQPVKAQAEFFTKLRTIFREVHGLKGDASSLNLHGFVSIAENLETSLKELQNKKMLNGEDFLTLTVSLEELFSLTQTIEDLNKRINHISGQEGNTGRVGRSIAASRQAANPEPAKSQLTKYAEELSQRCGKRVDFSCLGMDNMSINMTIKTQLRELAVQLLRNAVVHGIENPEIRLNKHKLSTGHVRMEMKEEGDSIRLIVEDDGAGINTELIRSKLVERGMYSKDEAAKLDTRSLIQKIFIHGFSTMEGSNQDAGRGVGMDIISDRIKQMKGRIALATRADAYTRVTLTVPKRI